MRIACVCAVAAILIGLAMPASALVFDNGIPYRWGDPFGEDPEDFTDHYAEVHRGDTISLGIWTNDLDGQAWVHPANGGITSVYGDGSVIDYTAITDTRDGYFSSYWGYTNNYLSGYGYWYLEYMGGQGQHQWVAEDRLVITLNLTIREDAPLGPTYIGLQQALVQWHNFWVTKDLIFEDRIDDNNDPGYRMLLNVVSDSVPGDFDGDGDIDADDVDDLCANMGGDVATYDMDGDGDVDEDDMTFHVENYLEYDTDGDGVVDGQGTFRGDFNADGAVNGTDLSIMSGSFGSAAGFAGGNANCDTDVNGTDLSILSSVFGNVVTAAVPEPASAALLVLGGCSLLKRRRRHN